MRREQSGAADNDPEIYIGNADNGALPSSASAGRTDDINNALYSSRLRDLKAALADNRLLEYYQTEKKKLEERISPEAEEALGAEYCAKAREDIRALKAAFQHLKKDELSYSAIPVKKAETKPEHAPRKKTEHQNKKRKEEIKKTYSSYDNETEKSWKFLLAAALLAIIVSSFFGLKNFLEEKRSLASSEKNETSYTHKTEKSREPVYNYSLDSEKKKNRNSQPSGRPHAFRPDAKPKARPKSNDFLPDRAEKSNSHSKNINARSVQPQLRGTITVSFGNYPQNSKGMKKNIEWIVLEHNKNGEALLLSKYLLEAGPFNREQQNISWKDSSVRQWLNSSFINTAFTSEEQQLILQSEIKNQAYSYYFSAEDAVYWTKLLGEDFTSAAGKDFNTSSSDRTRDKIFLLSAAEAEKYLNRENLAARPTDYALTSKGGKIKMSMPECSKSGCRKTEITGTSGWWLRTSATDSDYAIMVYGNKIFPIGNKVSYSGNGIRPALRIKNLSLLSITE